MNKLTITSSDYHRNGVCGEGFYVFLFRDNVEKRNMMAVVFPLDGGKFYSVDEKNRQEWNGRVSVFDVDLVAQGNIVFGVNSWRGDHYEAELRKYIHENQ